MENDMCIVNFICQNYMILNVHKKLLVTVTILIVRLSCSVYSWR